MSTQVASDQYKGFLLEVHEQPMQGFWVQVYDVSSSRHRSLGTKGWWQNQEAAINQVKQNIDNYWMQQYKG